MKCTNFNMAWKSDPQFKSWVTEDPVSKGNFRYFLCRLTLDLESMSKNALVKHLVKEGPCSKILKRLGVHQLQSGAELELNLVMLVTKMMAV